MSESERYYVANDYVATRLCALYDRLFATGLAKPSQGSSPYGYVSLVETPVFILRPYWNGECTCGGSGEDDGFGHKFIHEHTDECELEKPNFKCGETEIRWYKRIGSEFEFRGPRLSEAKWGELFDRCEASVGASKGGGQ